MAKLSTQPYKGARDFYPAEMRIQKYIFETWRQVVESYGYEEYDAPMLEVTDIYRAKTGEEIVNEQTYTMTDRGGREITIRPEMTPSVARMVAAKQQELPYPLRWYNIGNRWRYERPQRGRVREFWQLDVDIFGVEGIEAEFEIIKIASDIMKAFNAGEDMFKIRINSRKLLSLLMGDYLGLDIATSHKLSKLLDRKEKMSEEGFELQAKAIVGDNFDKLQALVSIKSLDDLPSSVVESGLVEELRMLFSQLEQHGVKNCQFDLTLMRGFDYYTGIVFEVFDTNPANPRAIFGGGRYDELTSIFEAPAVPAVGFAKGDVGTYNFLETHQLLPAFPSTTQVYVATVGDFAPQAQELAAELRQAGVNASVDVTDRKPATKIKQADKQDIGYVIFVGEKEVKAKEYTLKNLNTGEEKVLAVGEISKDLK